jgi:hypothetical protein
MFMVQAHLSTKTKWGEKVLSHHKDFFGELTLAQPYGELDFKISLKLQFV